METVVDLGGVRTWYAVDGAGDPLVYLHGGFSDADELDPVRAHVRRPVPGVLAGPARPRAHPGRRGRRSTSTATATDTIAFLEDVVGGPADLVGFSDGATAALHVALRRPDLVRRMVMISGQYHRDGLLPDLFGDDLDDAVARDGASRRSRERYGRLSPDGAGHFPVVAEKVMRSAFEEPRLDVDELSRVQARTLDRLGRRRRDARSSTLSSSTAAFPTPSWPSSPARRTS